MKKKLLIACFPAALLAVPCYVHGTNLIDDCINLVKSQQYVRAEMVGRQAVQNTNAFLAFMCLGKAQYEQGKTKDALQNFLTADKMAREDWQISGAAGLLGHAYSTLGDKDKALEYYKRELAISRRQGNQAGEAVALNSIGLIYDEKGDLDTAQHYYEESLRIDSDENAKSATLNNMALLLSKKGNKTLAISRLEEVVVLARRLGNHHYLGRGLINLGAQRREAGDLEGAEANLTEGLTYLHQVGDMAWEASGLTSLADLKEAQGDLPQAKAAWNKAASLYRSVGNTNEAESAEARSLLLVSAKGCEKFREDKPALALSIADAVLKKSPKDAEALLCLGKIRNNEKNTTKQLKP